MALQDYYNTDDDNIMVMSSTTSWYAQSFTADASYDIASVKLKLYKSAGLTGTLTVSIRAASGDNPTGADLCSGQVDLTALTDSTPGTFIEITFASPASLVATNQYAIVLREDQTSNSIKWRGDFSSPAYAGGSSRSSSDSGSTWGAYGTGDFMFETYSAEAGVDYVDVESTINLTIGMSGTLEVVTYIDLESTIDITIGVSGTLAIISTIDLEATIPLTIGLSGTLTVATDFKTENIIQYKRLIAIGNDQLYYEDI